jgi:hypothetical protein
MPAGRDQRNALPFRRVRIFGRNELRALDELSRRQAEGQRDNFDETVNQRMNETFVWALVPSQAVGSADTSWEAIKVTGADPLPVRVSRKLEQTELLVTKLGGVRLRMDLDRVPLWQGDHIATQQLWSYFAQYLYLPRLRDRSVLVHAIENGVADIGWEQDTFAYAQAVDKAGGRYLGLVAGSGATVLVDSESVVVKPEAAKRQLDAESASESETGVEPTVAVVGPDVGPGAVTPLREKVVRRFFAVKSLDPQRVSRDADQIATEIVTHLVGLVGADVEVKVEITADVPDGVPDEVVRTVTENAKTLKFEQHGFEES